MKNQNIKYLLQNKKDMRHYEIFTEYQCGLVLNSAIIKKILNFELSLNNSYGWIKKNEIYLKNFDKEEEIKLLLNREEINKIIKYKNEKKYLLIPKNLYLKNNKIKICITLSKYEKVKSKEKLQKIKRKDQKKIDSLSC